MAFFRRGSKRSQAWLSSVCGTPAEARPSEDYPSYHRMALLVVVSSPEVHLFRPRIPGVSYFPPKHKYLTEPI